MRKKEKEMRACGLDVCVMQEIGEALSIVLTIFQIVKIIHEDK